MENSKCLARNLDEGRKNAAAEKDKGFPPQKNGGKAELRKLRALRQPPKYYPRQN